MRPAGLGFGCTEADFDPATTSLLYGGGVVVGPNGKAAFEASYATGDASHAGVRHPGVTHPLGAEIHVVVRSHVPAAPDPDMRESQLTTYDGGCRDAQLGVPGPNVCRDLQFGFFIPPATPRTVTAACRCEGFAAVIPIDADRLRARAPAEYTITLDDTGQALLGVYAGVYLGDHPGEDAAGAMAVVDEPVDPEYSFSLYDFWEFSDSLALAGAMAYMGKPSELVPDMRVDFERVGGLVVGATATVPWTAGGFSVTAVIAGNVPDDSQGSPSTTGWAPPATSGESTATTLAREWRRRSPSRPRPAHRWPGCSAPSSSPPRASTRSSTRSPTSRSSNCPSHRQTARDAPGMTSDTPAHKEAPGPPPQCQPPTSSWWNSSADGSSPHVWARWSCSPSHLGVQLGLYRALADTDPQTCSELAGRTRLTPRYVRERLQAQVISGFLSIDGDDIDTGTFTLAAGIAETLIDETGLIYVGALAGLLPPTGQVTDDLLDAFRTGEGVPYDQYGAAATQEALNRPRLPAPLRQRVPAAAFPSAFVGGA